MPLLQESQLEKRKGNQSPPICCWRVYGPSNNYHISVALLEMQQSPQFFISLVRMHRQFYQKSSWLLLSHTYGRVRHIKPFQVLEAQKICNSSQRIRSCQGEPPLPRKKADCHEVILMQIFRQKSLASWFLKESKLPSNRFWKMPGVLTFNIYNWTTWYELNSDRQGYVTSTFIIWTPNLY